MELKWLEDFLALAEQRTFARASAVRHVTQPAFGRRIRALMEWFGTRLFVRSAQGAVLEPRTTPIESPQSNGMAEAFVRTIRRDYVRVNPLPDAQTVMRQLSAWITHYKHASQHPSVYVIEGNRVC